MREGQRINESQKSFEVILPEGYPQLLFTGTAPENAKSMKINGGAIGTWSSTIMPCFDDRFYRGRMGIVEYNSQIFAPREGIGIPWSTFDNISVGKAREITYTNVDTDGMKHEFKMTTDKYIPPEELSFLEISEEQKEYLNLFYELMNGSLVGDYPQDKVKKISELIDEGKLAKPKSIYDFPFNYGQYASNGLTSRDATIYMNNLRQLRVANLLGIDADQFKDNDTIETCLNNQFGGEEGVIQRFSEMFPGSLSWDGKNLQMEDSQFIQAVLRQMYQYMLISRYHDHAESGNPLSYKTLMLNGNSSLFLRDVPREKPIEIQEKVIDDDQIVSDNIPSQKQSNKRRRGLAE